MNVDTDKILNFLQETRSKSNTLKGHILAERDAHTKELYMVLLSCVALVDGDVGKEKLRFLSSILSIIGLKDDIESYFNKAADLKYDDLKGFVDKITSGNLPYSFILDSLILSIIDGNVSERESNFVGELAEALEIDEKVMEFLCDLCICIVEQNSNSFDEILNKIPSKIRISEFKPYLLDFTDGLPFEYEYITDEVHLVGKHIINKPVVNEGVLNIENATITFKGEGKITSREGSELYIKASEIVNSEFIFEEKSKLAATDSLFRDNDNKRVFTLQQCRRQNFIENCTFKNCHLDDNGGVIYILESILDMNKNTFFNCTSAKNGGAIYIDGENDRVISWSNLKFDDCEGERGGAIYQSCFNIYYFLSDSIFYSCKANESGGAIYIRNENYEYDAIISRSEFNNCLAKHVGTIFLYCGYADKNVVGCRFNKCASEDNYISGIGIFNRSNSFGNENIFSNCVNPIGNVSSSNYF